MADQLPRLARRRAAVSGQWWRPGLPVHQRPEPEDYTIADAVLRDEHPASWETEAMRWAPPPREDHPVEHRRPRRRRRAQRDPGQHALF